MSHGVYDGSLFNLVKSLPWILNRFPWCLHFIKCLVFLFGVLDYFFFGTKPAIKRLTRHRLSSWKVPRTKIFFMMLISQVLWKKQEDKKRDRPTGNNPLKWSREFERNLCKFTAEFIADCLRTRNSRSRFFMAFLASSKRQISFLISGDFAFVGRLKITWWSHEWSSRAFLRAKVQQTNQDSSSPAHNNR